ncbi:DUF421 domain-containing protein [Pedobacter frigoris]|uniref:DUF421 domain-containing protein n=1 Tax=Pedobacter frigoris TaxID=2571272 RepID=A0A4U1CHW9_9SPHI|nr:DUF421 domain-containing protein [Pedobacter frigoris]TKC06207.1 DUF421 domain-containing protein [Pedobacter frigoris]
MTSIDWNKFFIGEEDWEFLLEISLRTILMYFIILIGLRLLGKRGVRQLSVFELVVIISLGSAAGDPMFYKEIGLLFPIVIFGIIVGAYRFTTYLMAKSTKIDDLVEGKCVYFIIDGEFSIKEFNKEGLAQDEFFSELRQQSVSHLGQVETAILETSGNLSIFFYPDEMVRYGLPIMPALFDKASEEILEKGKYACSHCGNILQMNPVKSHQCDKCGHKKWVKALNSCRVR